MAGEVLAEAGWAVWSKHPGTRDDYSVLACSDTFSKTDFAKIISRYAAGTPDTRAVQGPGGLPWVTVSWVGVDDALRLGLALTDQTEHVDGVGRPITRTRYFCVPYEQLRRDAVSYTALYKAVRQVTSLPDAGQPVSLAVPRLTTADLLASVLDDCKIDQRVVGATAALLLDGPVTVVQAEGSTVEERLAFIDAVASVLPYGYRAKFTAGTWADSGTRHRLRLAFAARPKDDAATVGWRQGGEVPAGDSACRRYFDQFRQLTLGETTGKVFPAPAVAEIIARKTEPQRFEQPEPAVAALCEIDLPWRLRRDIRDEVPVSLADLRWLFESGRLAELDAPRGDLLDQLSLIGEARDWPLLAGRLEEAGADRTAPGPVLAQFSQRMLWVAQPAEDVVRECLKTAVDRGIGDSVLANLVRLPVPTTGHETGVRIMTALLEEAVFGGQDNRAAHPHTRQQLAANPVAAAELMAALVPRGHAAELLGWLAPVLPGPLTRTFEPALSGKRGKTAAADIAELSELGDDCVRAMLAAASGNGRLDSVLTGFTEWLVTRGTAGAADRNYWQQALAGLVPGDAEQRAYLDTALLSVGAPLTALPPAVGRPGYPGYTSQLAGIWKRLAASGRFSPEDCMRTLAGYLDGQPWTATRQQAQAVAELANKIGIYDKEYVLLGTIASGLDATPSARGWDFAQKLLEWVRKNAPDAVRNGLVANLASLPASASPDQIAGLCRRAAARNIKPDAAFAALAQSGAIGSAAAAAHLLLALHREFDRAQIVPKVTSEWQRRLASAIAEGEFSGGRPDFPREAREVLSGYARYEMWQHFDLLSMLTKAVRDGHYDVGDEERDDLTALTDAVDGFLRKAAKRPPRWRNVLPGGWGDDEDRKSLWQDVSKTDRDVR